MENETRTYVAFLGQDLVKEGPLAQVAVALKQRLAASPNETGLIFEGATGRQIDVDLRGSDEDLARRHGDSPQAGQSTETTPSKKRGRPKLGVVGREVTLLPKDWQWLDRQRGGASATLRRLVSQARKANSKQDLVRESQDRTNRFIAAIAGNLPGFEEATRALYAGSRERFVEETKSWPAGIRRITLKFSQNAFIG